jgi:hypothetical protein
MSSEQAQAAAATEVNAEVEQQQRSGRPTLINDNGHAPIVRKTLFTDTYAVFQLIFIVHMCNHAH